MPHTENKFRHCGEEFCRIAVAVACNLAEWEFYGSGPDTSRPRIPNTAWICSYSIDPSNQPLIDQFFPWALFGSLTTIYPPLPNRAGLAGDLQPVCHFGRQVRSTSFGDSHFEPGLSFYMVSLPSVHKQPAQLDLRGKRGKSCYCSPLKSCRDSGPGILAKVTGGHHALNRLSPPCDTVENGIFATHGHRNDVAYGRV